jgi:hypothetical protein
VPKQIIAKLHKLAARAREQHSSRAEAGLNKASSDAARVTAADWQRYARSPLFTSKRAREIATLLETRNTLLDAYDGVSKAKRHEFLLASATGRAAFLKVVRLARSMTVGTEIADLTVCGSVPPYNAILGGKLVAMLATSPEVVLEYKRRYQSLPSIIASSMAGRAIVRPRAKYDALRHDEILVFELDLSALVRRNGPVVVDLRNIHCREEMFGAAAGN